VTWTDAKNDRRCELIDQPRRSPNDQLELEDLEKQMRVHRHAVAPLPIEEARAALQQAKARVD